MGRHNGVFVAVIEAQKLEVCIHKQNCTVEKLSEIQFTNSEHVTVSIAMFLVTSPFVYNVPTRGLLTGETMHAIVQWLENLNIKRNMTSMFENKKHRYSHHNLWDLTENTQQACRQKFQL